MRSPRSSETAAARRSASGSSTSGAAGWESSTIQTVSGWSKAADASVISTAVGPGSPATRSKNCNSIVSATAMSADEKVGTIGSGMPLRPVFAPFSIRSFQTCTRIVSPG